jgi:TolA-binding protein
MVKIKGLSSISSNSWKKWQKAFPDIVSSLVYIYKSTNQNNEAEGVLVDWISRFPNDSNAKKLLEEVRNPD